MDSFGNNDIFSSRVTVALRRLTITDDADLLILSGRWGMEQWMGWRILKSIFLRLLPRILKECRHTFRLKTYLWKNSEKYINNIRYAAISTTIESEFENHEEKNLGIFGSIMF